MTSAEWADAFRKGDPEAVGQALLAAIRQAYTEATASREARDIGELAPGFDRDVIAPLMTRAGQILRDQGVITIPGDSSP